MTDSSETPFARWQSQQVAELGQRITSRRLLRSEASHRRFERVELAPAAGQARTLIAMASPPSLERNQSFVTLAKIFGEAGIPVPEVLAYDEQHGWLLLTDLGEQDFEAIYGTAAEEPAMHAALALLPRLQAIRADDIEPYTAERLHTELGIFSDWLVEGVLASELPAAVAESFEQLVARIDAQPRVCVHRDYHCRNLLWNHDTLGVVDFQDALHGPRCYDLASLLHDCYYRWPAARLTQYRDLGHEHIAPDQAPDDFRQDLEWTAIQRQLKAMGIFLRLLRRDGRETHVPHVLPTLEQTIALTARYPALSALAHWLEAQRIPLATAIGKLASNG